jgi:two-component system, NtrC family, response regulator PilR
MRRAVAAESQNLPSNRKGTILVIDDEEIMREILEALLTREGYEVRLAANAAEGLELARSLPFDAAVVDMMMPGMDGISTLEELKKTDDDLPVLMITAFASVENAIKAMKRGAFDYITKPFKNDEVLVVLRNALAQRTLVAENRALRQNLQARANRFGEIIGRSSPMRQVFDLIIQAAPSRTTILINGESGTGKELIARSLHQNSVRSDRAFITVNSGNLPPDLLESNLFGHVKGAFTGANADRPGLFEAAHGGTIFLDEIGELPVAMQVKLLRVLQERKVKRVGGVQEKEVDVRVVAATNRDLEAEVEKGAFRQDLFYRLNVIQLRLPPLRERREDLPLLVDHFLRKFSAEHGRPLSGIDPDAMSALMGHSFPGNVRELENLIERAVTLAPGDRISADTLPTLSPMSTAGAHASPSPGMPAEGLDLEKVVEDFERGIIIKALEHTRGNRTEAARLLGVTFRSLRYRLSKLGISGGEPGPEAIPE